jgi:hypothetical protein
MHWCCFADLTATVVLAAVQMQLLVSLLCVSDSDSDFDPDYDSDPDNDSDCHPGYHPDYDYDAGV